MVNTAITGRKLRTGIIYGPNPKTCLLYTSDAADE